jgi:hypothetical protein
MVVMYVHHKTKRRGVPFRIVLGIQEKVSPMILAVKKAYSQKPQDRQSAFIT